MDLFGDTQEEETIEEGVSSETPPPEIELFNHPRTMPFCRGQEKAEKTLIDLHNTKRMPHGIIFTGIKGVGKATTAYRFARFLLKHGAGETEQNALFADETHPPDTLDIPLDDRIARQVTAGAHPDLLYIERAYDAEKNKTQSQLAVSELRKVEPFLRKTSSNGGWRVVIIDDADTMNRNAQNALLKILEEPPKNTVLILIAHRAGALIPTIRSRTRSLRFENLPAETITELLNEKGEFIDPFQGETLCAFAQGSFGSALSYYEQGGLEMLETITNSIKTLNEKQEWSAIHALSDRLGKATAGQSNDYEMFCTLLIWLYKTLSFAKARGTELSPAAINEPPLTTTLQNSSLASLLKICENLSDCFETTERANLDKRQAVLNAFRIITA